MKAMFSIFLTILFASSSLADTVFLKNGQSFRGSLVRVTPEEVFVDIGPASVKAEVNFDILTVGRVENDRGEVIFRDGRLLSPDPNKSRWTVESYGDGDGAISITSGALSRGTYSMGGVVSYSSLGGDINEGVYGVGNDNRMSLLSVSPGISYYLADNIGIGVDFMYARQWATGQSTDQLSFGPKITYAFPLEGSIRPHLSAGIGMMKWKFSQEGEYSDVGMTTTAGAGLFYFVQDHYATTIELAYRWDRFDPDQAIDPITGNSLLFSIGLTGFLY